MKTTCLKLGSKLNIKKYLLFILLSVDATRRILFNIINYVIVAQGATISYKSISYNFS